MEKILIVDDDQDIVSSLQLVLQKAGYAVVVAYNKPSGLEQIQRENPDLLILDVMMEQPDDGLAMAQELRGQGYKFPILMLTSISSVTGFKVESGSSLVPVDLFFEKPLSPQKLLAAVKTLLAKK